MNVNFIERKARRAPKVARARAKVRSRAAKAQKDLGPLLVAVLGPIVD